MNIHRKKHCLIILLLAVLSCSGAGIYEINLMPAPDVYDPDLINPFMDNNPIESIPFEGILYATDREPAKKKDKELFYQNNRGHVLRLGIGKVSLGKKAVTWEEAKRISLLKNRTEDYPLNIKNIEEFGILDTSLNIFTKSYPADAERRNAATIFAGHVNDKLALSKKKDIFIYVHGYKVVFENPLLVAMELWHYLGYEGVFIAYAWPSTPSSWAYTSDVETASHTARNLRLLIEYLDKNTRAEKINIVGYSAGTRVVIEALSQLTLKNIDQGYPVIGHVILTGSDFDRDIFAGYLADGILDKTQSFNIYLSEGDKALGLSKMIFGRQRLGQLKKDYRLDPELADYLFKTKNLNLIDVTDAESSTAGNGHAYFRKSPWVSSDILMTLMFGLPPESRGLIYNGDQPVWIFPDDYIKRLRAKLVEMHPKLSNNQ